MVGDHELWGHCQPGLSSIVHGVNGFSSQVYFRHLHAGIDIFWGNSDASTRDSKGSRDDSSFLDCSCRRRELVVGAKFIADRGVSSKLNPSVGCDAVQGDIKERVQRPQM